MYKTAFKISGLIFLLMGVISACAQKENQIQQRPVLAQADLSALIPFPNKVIQRNISNKFKITKGTYIEINSDSLTFDAHYLQNVISNRMGINLLIKKEVTNSQNAIKLEITHSTQGNEHYLLDISDKQILIKGLTHGAVFYGIATLDQILMGDVPNTNLKQVAPVLIDDQPRIPLRILMLDPARHFLPIKDVEFFVDQMAKYKFNTLQLHLTDDEGWRIQINKYPKLTSKGAVRNLYEGMNGPDNGFYTQEQLRDLVKYAADRNVQIIPEIDMPGHSSAAIIAYPELGCTNSDSIPKVLGNTKGLMLDAASPEVYTMYKDILEEVASIFPSKYIHLGGDEANIGNNWAKCERDQALMKQLNYKSDTMLMEYFFKKIFSFMKEDGKTPIMWCELNNIRPPASNYLFPYPKDVTLVTWRMGLTPKCMELTRKSGNPIILAPGEFCYINYTQYKGELPNLPVATLEKVYSFDPGYGLTKEDQTNIFGISGTLWGEYIKKIQRAFYMAYPRALALAEAGWTNMDNRSWSSFKKRMYPNLTGLMKDGVSFRVPFEVADGYERH